MTFPTSLFSSPVLVAAALSTLLLAGCTTTPFDLQDDAQFQQTIPLCQSNAECDKVWAAARDWVNQTTSQGLAVDTDQRLQTLPADAEALDWETDITIKKVPVDEGQYQIVIETLCNPAFNDCGAERNRMRQFNADMARFVSSDQSQQTRRIIRQGVDLRALFDDYASAMMAADLRPHAQQYYLPTLVISGDGEVRQLQTRDEVLAFLSEIRAQLADHDISRITVQNPQILSSDKSTTLMKLQWVFLNADGELQYRQKAIYNLIKVGEAWKIIMVSYSD